MQVACRLGCTLQSYQNSLKNPRAAYFGIFLQCLVQFCSKKLIHSIDQAIADVNKLICIFRNLKFRQKVSKPVKYNEWNYYAWLRSKFWRFKDPYKSKTKSLLVCDFHVSLIFFPINECNIDYLFLSSSAFLSLSLALSITHFVHRLCSKTIF